MSGTYWPAMPPPGDAPWPCCSRCGAVVLPPYMTMHDQWHAADSPGD